MRWHSSIAAGCCWTASSASSPWPPPWRWQRRCASRTGPSRRRCRCRRRRRCPRLQPQRRLQVACMQSPPVRLRRPRPPRLCSCQNNCLSSAARPRSPVCSRPGMPAARCCCKVRAAWARPAWRWTSPRPTARWRWCAAGPVTVACLMPCSSVRCGRWPASRWSTSPGQSGCATNWRGCCRRWARRRGPWPAPRTGPASSTPAPRPGRCWPPAASTRC